MEKVFRARVHLKRPGKECEQLRRNVSNRPVSGKRDYPMNVGELHMKMEFCKPNLSQKRESDGTQYRQTE